MKIEVDDSELNDLILGQGLMLESDDVNQRTRAFNLLNKLKLIRMGRKMLK